MHQYESAKAVVSAGQGQTPNKSLVQTTLRVAAQLKRYVSVNLR